MPCLKVDLPTPPTLPAPLTLEPPPLPPLPTAKLCCKVEIEIPIPPILFPGAPLIINPALVAVINANLALVKVYLDQIEVPCPKN